MILADASLKNSSTSSSNVTEVCNGNGYLNKINECICNKNFAGVNCENILCTENDEHYKQCKNSGYCMKNVKTHEYICKCNSLFTGALCEIPQGLNYCYHGGLYELNNSKCKCQDRFGGRRCEFDKCINEVFICKIF